MAVGSATFPDCYAIPGFRLGTTSAGIKKPGRLDLVVMEVAAGSTAAACFTRNAFCAAPVELAKSHLSQKAPRYLLTNTGNANAGTGNTGLAHARACCEQLAQLAAVKTEEILPFSTGVIGEPLPVAKILPALPAALVALDDNGWTQAAKGIMTTDTRPKGATVRFEYQGQAVHLSGIAKGSGMIHPDMATMLGYVATDARIEPELLQSLLSEAVQLSFNRVSVDGDTSTNDAVVLVATGQSAAIPVSSEHPQLLALFRAALNQVCLDLAQQIVKDGEGATKFVTIQVAGGKTSQECLDVGFAIAHSPLVKTALFASDPNWGRILAVVGRAGLSALEVDKVRIHLDEVLIVEDGALAASYTEAQGQAVMNREEITIAIELGRGSATESVWTCDLSHDYVSINADYRS